MTAVVAALDGEPPADPAALLKRAGMTLVSTVGGASGPLYGTLFLRMAAAAGDAEALDARGVRARRCGPAWTGWSPAARRRPGDKTMFDALAPAVRRLDAALAAAPPRRGAAGRGRPRPRRAGRDDPAAGPQGPGQLPGRAQRRPPGPGRDVGGAAARPRRRPPSPPAAEAWRVVGIVVVSHSRALAERRGGAGAARWCTAQDVRIEVAAGLDDGDVRHRRGRHRRRHGGGRRRLRRRRADGPGQRGAVRRAGAGAAGRRRCATGCCSARRRWSRGWSWPRWRPPAGPGRAEVAAEAAAALAAQAVPARRRRRRRRAAGTRRRAATGRPGARRRFVVHEPARSARPTGRPAGRRWSGRSTAAVELRNRTTGVGLGARGEPVAGRDLGALRGTRSRCGPPGRAPARGATRCWRWPAPGSTRRRRDAGAGRRAAAARAEPAARRPVRPGPAPRPASPSARLGLRAGAAGRSPTPPARRPGARAGGGSRPAPGRGPRGPAADRARPRAAAGDEAAIFDAHLLLLDDAELLDDVRPRIDAGDPPPPAWAAAVDAGGGRLRRAAPTRTCGPAPPTSARWATRSCARCSACAAPGALGRDGVLVAADLTPAAGRRARPGAGRRGRARRGQPDRAQRDPAARPGHPGGGRRRAGGAGHRRTARWSPWTAAPASWWSTRPPAVAGRVARPGRRAAGRGGTAAGRVPASRP